MLETQSRPKRWADATKRAADALEDLVVLQNEYEILHYKQPVEFFDSNTGKKLLAVEDLNLKDALCTIEAAKKLDLPKFYGRD